MSRGGVVDIEPESAEWVIEVGGPRCGGLDGQDGDVLGWGGERAQDYAAK